MKHIWTAVLQTGYLAIAVILLFVMIPLLPSSLLLQPESLTVDGMTVRFVRDVTIPVNAEWEEVYSDPTGLRVSECTRRGIDTYEDRDSEPVLWLRGCPQLESGFMTACWSVLSPISGRPLRPVCREAIIVPPVSLIEEQSEAIMKQQAVIEDLSKRVEELVQEVEDVTTDK